ncbi:MAG: universal stress protein [Halothiobacillaceae bacterium]|jgi:nucleotide-binding universal stress UspA family protein|nr:universal stress protein [Halothiobacillaceae bacterium]MDY0050755.1 universal stress protein [Halothiobacillaceae bacterium]
MSQQYVVLVASDLSDRADKALYRAAQLVSQHDARLEVLHVIHDAPMWDVFKSNTLNADHMLDQISLAAISSLKLRVQATNYPVTTAHYHTRTGARSYAEIINHARETGSDLIVVGAHGQHYSQLTEALLGTNAERVVENSDRPVLVVKNDTTGPYKHIVVGTDFSEPSRFAVLAAHAVSPEADITLVHVRDSSYEASLRSAGIDEKTLAQYRAEDEKRLHTHIRDWARELDLPSHKLHTQVLEGRAGPTLLEVAQKHEADLIACGTLGVSAVRALLVGSVARHILRNSRCDVLTMHQFANSDTSAPG